MMLIYSLFAQDVTMNYAGLEDTVITDPMVSLRCKEISERRSSYIEYKNRILMNLEKNRLLRNITPNSRIVLLAKLDKNFDNLSHELFLARQKIPTVEEEMILKGCPMAHF